MRPQALQITSVPLQVSVDRSLDHVLAIAVGRVVDGKYEDEYVEIAGDAKYVLEEAGGEVIGFVIDGIADYDVAGTSELWEGHSFCAPTLGLGTASVGEIATAALNACPDSDSLDVSLFYEAIDAADEDLEAAATRWRLCLATGNLKAHFGLGYTLHDLGNFRQAYTHLRYYTELVPRNSWAWCWLGHTCAELGENAESADAYGRAIELEETGAEPTDAAERLEAL